MRAFSIFLTTVTATALLAGAARAELTLTINNSKNPTLSVSGGSLAFVGVNDIAYSGTWNYNWTLLKNDSAIHSETQSLSCGGFPCQLPTFQYTIPAGCGSGTYKLKLKVTWFGIPGHQGESNSITVTAPGSPMPVLKVNGQKGTNINVCAAGPITVDASQSTCTQGYFIGMELSDQNWHSQGPPSTRWLTSQDFQKYGPLAAFDAKRFFEDRWFQFVPGQYYRLGLATSPWVATTSLLHVLGSTASLTINGSTANPTVVDAAGPILLNGSTSVCATGYFVGVQLSDPSWNRFGNEVAGWLSGNDLSASGPYGPINKFDVKKYAENHGLPIVAGSYYRVTLAVGTPWSESTILIRATGWTPWLNADGPGGVGDFELLSNFVATHQACSDPLEIQCQTVQGVDWKAAGQVYTCDVHQGGICRNDDQGQNGFCLDYQVRFRC